MKIFDDFIKAKEDHIIDRYCEDGEPCLDCIEPTDAHNTREVKKKYVDEIVDEIVHHQEHE